MARARTAERGVALLVVIMAVAVLTALAVDLAYDTRVSLRIAANARDDLRAAALAKGGVALSRLVLGFQQEIDGVSGGQNLPNASMPRLQLWRLVPVGSELADGLFGGAGAGRAREEGDEGAPRRDGFEAVIEDEGSKVNVQLDASYTGGLLAAQVQALYQLVCEPRWDALFDREDERGLRVSRQDLLVYLRDWIDPNSEASAPAAAFPPGGCVMLTSPGKDPFERGFQDENFPYDRGEDRYRAKNARMDSLAELYLVAGVTDAFMAAFGDAITAYLPVDTKPNVNETDPAKLLGLAGQFAPGQAALYDAEFLQRLHRTVLQASVGGLLSYSPVQFAQLVRDAGAPVTPAMLDEKTNPFTDRSTVFRVRARGRAGDVTKRIDAVLQLKTTPGGPVTIPGSLVHWREE